MVHGSETIDEDIEETITEQVVHNFIFSIESVLIGVGVSFCYLD